jgi:acetamidase/formamidase
MGWTKEEAITYYDEVFRAKIPINYHVGCMGLAPESHDFVDSIPPMPTGGNLDNKRIGVGTTMYYPVEVAGGMISMGDAHAAQGDSELNGTGVETSLTGKFKLTVIKAADFTPAQAELDFPLGETETEWIVHGFTATDYLETYFDNPGDIYDNSDLNKAAMNAFTQSRKFLMNEYGLTEYEAWTIITQGADFGMTQVVDGNCKNMQLSLLAPFIFAFLTRFISYVFAGGVHAVIPKLIFQEFAGTGVTPQVTDDGERRLADVTLPLSADNVVSHPRGGIRSVPIWSMVLIKAMSFLYSIGDSFLKRLPRF